MGKKVRLGTILAFFLCGLLTTPSGDPLSIMINGATGAIITFFLLRWILSRQAAASWSTRRQTVFAVAISVCVMLVMNVMIAVFLLPDNRVLVTTVTLREKQAAPTSFHGYYVVQGLTNQVRGTLPASFTLSNDVRSIHYEFVCDQPEPREIELVISGADGSSTSLWKNRISGKETWIRHADGTSEWSSERSPLDFPPSAAISPNDRP